LACEIHVAGAVDQHAIAAAAYAAHQIVKTLREPRDDGIVLGTRHVITCEGRV